MHQRPMTLPEFLVGQLRETVDETDRPRLQVLLQDIARAVRAVTSIVARGALDHAGGVEGGVDAHGDERKHLELAANAEFVAMCERNACVAGLVSDATNIARETGAGGARGEYLVVLDPLAGSSNTGLNVAVGSIFSLLQRRAGQPVSDAAFLCNGREQLAAGYAIYGPATMLVLTVGLGTHGFTLDRDAGAFLLTHPFIRIPAPATEFSINAANERFWEPPVLRYVRECRAGSAGERQQDFSARWVASMVADVHRLLMRGGVYLHPRDRHRASHSGGLRLLHEANPVAFIVEQAGGLASTGRGRIVDAEPEALHDHVPVILGSKAEVERLERYHREYDNGVDKPFVSPLFNERSLFRPEARI